jgi:hypothetical protein
MDATAERVCYAGCWKLSNDWADFGTNCEFSCASDLEVIY